MTLRDRVKAVMADGQWRTLYEIRDVMLTRFYVAGSDSGISAKLRDLRKAQFGGHLVDSRRRLSQQWWTPGQVWEYRLVLNGVPKEV
jgi:hypothetical protein